MAAKNKLSADLGNLMSEYHKHNYYFELALAKRHDRWKTRGLLKSVPPPSWPGRNGRRA